MNICVKSLYDKTKTILTDFLACLWKPVDGIFKLPPNSQTASIENCIGRPNGENNHYIIVVTSSKNVVNLKHESKIPQTNLNKTQANAFRCQCFKQYINKIHIVCKTSYSKVTWASHME